MRQQFRAAALAALCLAGSPTSAFARQTSDASSDRGVISSAPAGVAIDGPVLHGRSVFISQIGAGNLATVRQTAAAARAHVRQNGDRNTVELSQQGMARSFADVQQAGDAHDADLTQGGAGANTLYLLQQGDGNRARAVQEAVAGSDNGATLMQTGSDNRMGLSQRGADNQAVLVQNGDGNAMSAAQTGDGNQLVWTQIGNGLSDLSIVQGGGQAMQITQSR